MFFYVESIYLINTIHICIYYHNRKKLTAYICLVQLPCDTLGLWLWNSFVIDCDFENFVGQNEFQLGSFYAGYIQFRET